MTLDSKRPFAEVLAQALDGYQRNLPGPDQPMSWNETKLAHARAIVAALPDSHNPDVLRAEVERLREVLRSLRAGVAYCGKHRRFEVGVRLAGGHMTPDQWDELTGDRFFAEQQEARALLTPEAKHYCDESGGSCCPSFDKEPQDA